VWERGNDHGHGLRVQLEGNGIDGAKRDRSSAAVLGVARRYDERPACRRADAAVVGLEEMIGDQTRARFAIYGVQKDLPNQRFTPIYGTDREKT
jgi:hypothetical protein